MTKSIYIILPIFLLFFQSPEIKAQTHSDNLYISKVDSIKISTDRKIREHITKKSVFDTASKTKIIGYFDEEKLLMFYGGESKENELFGLGGAPTKLIIFFLQDDLPIFASYTLKGSSVFGSPSSGPPYITKEIYIKNGAPIHSKTRSNSSFEDEPNTENFMEDFYYYKNLLMTLQDEFSN
ncbi:MAG: hypothetical protein LBE36_03880 [Flavobacteriaceae bacterium]|jgi:hypothetical protein|nr:hypothetical protein [Flavobacteriaceae bacterium]